MWSRWNAEKKGDPPTPENGFRLHCRYGGQVVGQAGTGLARRSAKRVGGRRETRLRQKTASSGKQEKWDRKPETGDGRGITSFMSEEPKARLTISTVETVGRG